MRVGTPPHRLESSILGVEDDFGGRDVVETCLRYVGATVRSTESAFEALELFKVAPPAVVVTDIDMGDTMDCGF